MKGPEGEKQDKKKERDPTEVDRLLQQASKLKLVSSPFGTCGQEKPDNRTHSAEVPKP